MNLVAFFLIVYVLGIKCIDVERIDKEYYMLLDKTNTHPGDYLENRHSMDKVKNHLDIEFVQVEIEETFNKYPLLIDRLDRLLSLSSRELIHTDNNNKIILIPFKSIRLTNDDGEINVGNYKGSYLKNSKIVQEYTGGDKCDICKGKNWSGTIYYMPETGELELSGPIENSTCNYKLIVKGEELGFNEKIHIVEVRNKTKNKENAQQATLLASEEQKEETGNNSVCSRNSCKNTPEGPHSILKKAEGSSEMDQTEEPAATEGEKKDSTEEIKKEDL